MTNTMWGGRFAASPSEIMEEINASIDCDKRLWRHDIEASKAHVAMLAATDLGLASVWVGAFNEDAVRTAIGAGADQRPVAILSVGYGAETPERRPRRPLDSAVQWIA